MSKLVVSTAGSTANVEAWKWLTFPTSYARSSDIAKSCDAGAGEVQIDGQDGI